MKKHVLLMISLLWLAAAWLGAMAWRTTTVCAQAPSHASNAVSAPATKPQAIPSPAPTPLPAIHLPEPLAAPPLLANYTIEAQLSFDEKGRPANLQGRERLTWKNDSPDTISELQFHLYLNAFKNERSSFFRESGGQLRNDHFTPGEWGWINVNKIAVVNGADLTAKREFIHPDDDNTDDQTVLRVPLPTPIKAGETIALDIEFTARLPRVFARTGYWGTFAMVGQWFPKIGVWEEKGERRREIAGWNCHQFHANTEFYSDYGNYDVTLTVPAVYRGKIGATGQQQSETVNQDGTVRYRYTQANVHDFAWTVDANFRVIQRKFRPADWLRPGELNQLGARLNVPIEQLQLQEVACTLLLQPEHANQADRHFNAAFNALKYYGLWYGAYPYDTLTIVDTPFQGDGAGGMEYPTLITSITYWLPDDGPEPETVIVHEFGHQYWYGLIASNEFEEAWLDEGFNTYSEAKVMDEAYGPSLLPFKLAGIPLMNLPIELPHPYEYRLGTFIGEFTDPLARPGWRYFNSESYALNSYARTGLTLYTLEAWLGKITMARVLREYATRWRYRHPTAQDFYDTAQQVSGQDLRWFFAQFFHTDKTLDYEIAAYESRPRRQALGIFERDGKQVEQTEADSQPGRGFDSVVTVLRNGEAWYPHELRISLADRTQLYAKPTLHEDVIHYQFTNSKTGLQWTDEWPIGERWKKFRFPTEQAIIAVQLDPENRVLLEANQVNNSQSEAGAFSGALRWSSGALHWVQSLLQLIGSLA